MMCACIYIYTPCIIMCLHTYITMYVCACMLSCIHTHTCIHTYIPTCKYTHIHTPRHAYMHTYIHKHILMHIHTYIYKYICTYMHTYIHTQERHELLESHIINRGVTLSESSVTEISRKSGAGSPKFCK